MPLLPASKSHSCFAVVGPTIRRILNNETEQNARTIALCVGRFVNVLPSNHSKVFPSTYLGISLSISKRISSRFLLNALSNGNTKVVIGLENLLGLSFVAKVIMVNVDDSFNVLVS